MSERINIIETMTRMQNRKLRTSSMLLSRHHKDNTWRPCHSDFEHCAWGAHSRQCQSQFVRSWWEALRFQSRQNCIKSYHNTTHVRHHTNNTDFTWWAKMHKLQHTVSVQLFNTKLNRFHQNVPKVHGNKDHVAVSMQLLNKFFVNWLKHITHKKHYFKQSS